MFRDEFKKRYTTIPFAVYRAYSVREKQVISHRHAEVELIAMTEGEADFYIDTKHYRLSKGDVLIIPPYSIHRAQAPKGETVSYNCICFDLNLIWDEEIKNGLKNYTLTLSGIIKSDTPYANKLQEWIDFGCTACESAHDGWELLAIGTVSMIFGHLKKSGCFTKAVKNNDKLDFTKRVMSYIVENYNAHVTSATAAASLYMNNSYFCRRFKKSFGCRFSDYILTYRLEKAKIYLATTAESVTEISSKTGFNGSSYFSKAFKSHFGISPIEYRRGAT